MSVDPIVRLRAADPLRGELPPPLEAMPRPSQDRAAAPDRRAPLVRANVVLLAAVALHGVDHALQETGLGEVTTEVVLGGVAIGVVALVSLVFALRAHRSAPVVAIAGGPWIAIAVVTSHFLPHWSAFSDSYAEIGAGAISYVAAGAVVAAGLAVGAAGVAALRPRRDVAWD